MTNGTTLSTIEFHGATLIAISGATPADTIVAMKPVVEGMGLDWSAQRKKLMRHPVLKKGVAVMAIPSEGGIQEMIGLPLSRLNLWLATINSDRVPDVSTRQKVVSYQEECADVLFAHFFGKTDDETSLLRQFEGMITTLNAVADRMIEQDRRINDLILTSTGRAAVKEMVSVRELLDQAKAVPKGRRSISGKVRNALQDRALQQGVSLRRCLHSNVWLFPVDFAGAFMAEIGIAWVREHNSIASGQGVLQLVPKETPTSP